MNGERVTVWFAYFDGSELLIESAEGYRTAKYIRLDHSHRAIGYRRQVVADEACFTSLDAVERLVAECRSDAEVKARKAAEATTRVRQAWHALVNLGGRLDVEEDPA